LTTSTNLRAHISTEIESWIPTLTTLNPPPKIFFSALGTTRSQAGSLAKQRLIDYDLNLSLAQAAKTAGASTYVLISVGMANSKSFNPYLKMKGELEDAVKALGFRNCVILRPGVIIGPRNDLRPPELVLQKIATWAGFISHSLKDPWAQEAGVIARAAIKAGQECAGGKRQEGAWILEQADIVRMGKV
jgi:hypothetical protein